MLYLTLILESYHFLSKKNENIYQLPYESELQSRNFIVVYDGNTSNLKEESKAVQCANILYKNGSKFSVKILKGGYEAFSRLYPFLRTQIIIYMPRVRPNFIFKIMFSITYN